MRTHLSHSPLWHPALPIACKVLRYSNLRCCLRSLRAYLQAGPAEAAKPVNTFQASKAAEAEFERIIKERSGGKLPSLSLRSSSEVRPFALACAAMAGGTRRRAAEVAQAFPLRRSARRARRRSRPVRRASPMRRSLSARHSSCSSLSGRRWRRCRHACRSSPRPLLLRRLASSASLAVTHLHVRSGLRPCNGWGHWI